ncbi:MAG: TrmH family RNA methyltransferase [Candidatus Kapaibacterium sp.]|jgi:tRNA (guanosine-2'-O-)-methyltransferase
MTEEEQSISNDRLPERSRARSQKIEQALVLRQPMLTVVVENIHDPHNFNAILRSCDAVGVMRVCLVYNIEKSPRLAHVSSSGAYKWIDFERFPTIESCYESLRKDGFRILATKIEPNAHGLYTNDLTVPTALVLGNEHRGISEQAAALADDLLYIPMHGMSESLNVSVAAAVCLFEAMRQRLAKGMYDSAQLSPEALRSKLIDWLTR